MLRRAARAAVAFAPGHGRVANFGWPVIRSSGGIPSVSPRHVWTTASVLDKNRGEVDDNGAAARREAAEKEAAKSLRAWSSPLFSHVDVETNDDQVIPRWANAMFIVAVVAVFGYAGNFAWNNEKRKSERKEREREEREGLARRAIESGMLRDHDRKNFARADEADPFDGMTPEEIAKLQEESAAGGGRFS